MSHLSICEQLVVALPIVAVIGCIAGTYFGWTGHEIYIEWKSRKRPAGAQEDK